MNVRITTLKDAPWPSPVAYLSDGIELKSIVKVDFHHERNELPTAIITVYCEEIEVQVDGKLVTKYMGKRYCLVEEF